MSLERAVWKWWYGYLSRLDRHGEVTFLNYGHATDPPLALEPREEPDRYCIQLYERVRAGVELAGRDVLEAGSGRGGGAAYLARRHSPRSYLGLDLARAATAFCHARHRVPGLAFVSGDVAALPLRDASFDVAINVESSHGYPRMDRFLAEVARVLRQGGRFLFTDFRAASAWPGLRAQLAAAGFETLEEERITPAVLRALDLDRARREALVRRLSPRLLRGVMAAFAGVPATSLHDSLRSGRREYFRFVLRSTGCADPGRPSGSKSTG